MRKFLSRIPSHRRHEKFFAVRHGERTDGGMDV